MDDDPAPGDKLSLGPAMLVVRVVQNARVTEAELELAYGEANGEGEPSAGPDRFDRALRKARMALRAFEARFFNRG
jgi:potassium/hydrogen antiporter